MNENKEKLKKSQIIENLSALYETISSVSLKAGRSSNEVALMAVTKFHSAEKVKIVLEQGHRLFGENRVQEAEQKYSSLKQDFPEARLHLIGPLQTNKVRQAINLFDVIETLDRPRLARALHKEQQNIGRCPDLYIQVNTGEEPQKAGVHPGELDELLKLSRTELNLPVKGLMCIPPADDEPALHFGFLATLARRHKLKTLSMGMSADFETAIKLGTSHVRIGTSIFGTR